MNAQRLRDLNLLLICVAILLTGLLLYQIIKPLDFPALDDASTKTDVTQFPPLQTRRNGMDTTEDYESIVKMNLFSSERTPPSGRSRTVSKGEGEGSTSFEGFVLIGTVLADEEKSFALIRKGGVRGGVKSYRVRDRVDGMILQDILYDRVVLTKNGREVVLLLEPREEEKRSNTPPLPKSIKKDRRKTPPVSQKSGQKTWTSKQRKGQ